MTLSSTITKAALAAEWDSFRTRVNASRAAAGKSWPLIMRRLALASTDAISLRALTFTVDDDAEVRMLGVKAITTASVTVTARLAALDALGANASDEYLQGEDITAAVTVNGTGRTRDATPFTTTDNRPRYVRLLRGVRYQLSLENSASNCTVAEAVLLLRTFRRRT